MVCTCSATIVIVPGSSTSRRVAGQRARFARNEPTGPARSSPQRSKEQLERNQQTAGAAINPSASEAPKERAPGAAPKENEAPKERAPDAVLVSEDGLQQ